MDYQNGVIEDLGAVMGTEAAMRLIAIYGGASLYVPDAASDEHAICRVVGRKAFERLCEEFGGQTIHPPRGDEFGELRRIRQVARLVSAGHHARGIAKMLGMSERQITNDIKEARTIALLPPDQEHMDRVRQVAALLSVGHRVAEIASMLGCTTRQVANYRAQAEELFLVPMVFGGKKETGQMPLVAEREGK